MTWTKAAAFLMLTVLALAGAEPSTVGAGDEDVHGGQDAREFDDEIERPVLEATPESLPWLLSLSPAGSTIELAEGTYPPLEIRGREDLHLRASENVIFSSASHHWGTGIHVVDSSDITIEGIRIERARHGVRVDSSTGVSLRQVTITDVGQRGVWVKEGSQDVQIEASSITNTGNREGSNRSGVTYRSLGEAIYIGSSLDPLDGTSGVVIVGNMISAIPAEAIDLKTGSTEIVVAGNVVTDVEADAGAIAVHPGKTESAAGSISVIANVVSDIRQSDRRGGHGVQVSTGSTVDANVIFDVEGHGIVVRDVYGPDQDVSLRNNTIFATAREAIRVRTQTPAIPNPTAWGNQGMERLAGFPERWLEDTRPTEDLWSFIADRVGEVHPAVDHAPADDAADPVEPDIVAQPQVAPIVPPPPAAVPKPTPGPAGEPLQVEDTFPVYDTAWQMLVRATPDQADEYFRTLADYGFTGSWSALIHHAPATYLHNHAGGGQVGSLQNGQIILSEGYIAHVRRILDAADRHGQKIGVVVAWQNTYLPGGNTGDDALSNRVEGTLTVDNAYAYGQQVAREFADHPAVAHWVFGGDAGTNNTEANKAVWRIMAQAFDDAGVTQPIGYHTPTVHFNQLNYAGEPWLDFIAPETGHNQGSTDTESQLRQARQAYGIPTWQGEPRYFNINFDWVSPPFRNPGYAEVLSDANAAKQAGVSGYVYGDAGRWAWCLFQTGIGDSTPCDPNNIAASFGQAERDLIALFR